MPRTVCQGQQPLAGQAAINPKFRTIPDAAPAGADLICGAACQYGNEKS